MAYRKKQQPQRGRVIILPGTPRPEDLALVSGMTLDELVRDIVNDPAKYAAIRRSPAVTADSPAPASREENKAPQAPENRELGKSTAAEAAGE